MRPRDAALVETLWEALTYEGRYKVEVAQDGYEGLIKMGAFAPLLSVRAGDRVVGILTETDVLRAFQEALGSGILSKPYRWAFAAR